MGFHAMQSVFAGDLVIYYGDTHIRVFPVPDLVFPAPDGEASARLEPRTILTNSDVLTLFLSLPPAPLDIEGTPITIFPRSWNVDLGIPFMFDLFAYPVASNSDRYATVTRYRLDVEWGRSTPSHAPNYMLSPVVTFAMKEGCKCC